ncbi:MAG: hypothetical protein IKE70_04620 [Bacilli bacterium]|nr:hypothetical protein [Bacilli bacterium]
MNKAMLTVGIIMLSLIALLMINVLTNYSTGGELDYYLVKETADAAALDAIDNSYYKDCGLIRMDKEKFVESFIYRFVNSVDGTRDYDVKFYDINEVPPRVSIKVDSLTVLAVNSKGKGEGDAYSDNKAADISTSYDLIVETKYYNDFPTEEGLRNSTSDRCKSLRDIK